MSNFLNFPVIYLFVSIIVSIVMGIYAWRNPQTRGSRAFAAACLISSFWMLGDAVSRVSESVTGELIGEILKYAAVPILPLALLVFVYQYCGKKISLARIKWLLVIPVFSWLMMVTSSWHQLFFSVMQSGGASGMKVEYGYYFQLVHVPYSYGLMLVSFFTLLMEFSRASRHYRKQILLLLFSLCIPSIVNILVISKVIGNFTPLSFPIFFTIMGYAIFRHQFLGSNPIAYETVFHTIRDGVLILDRHDIIRDINPSAAKGLEKHPAEIVGLHVREAFKEWQTAVEAYDKNPLKIGEIEVFLFGQKRFLSVESTPLAARNDFSGGRIISIRDITNYHQYKLSLEALAFHDPLTRVANRRKFQEEVERAIEKSNNSDKTFAILYFDLNRFKLVNDTLGHETGDELLKYVAARVASILRKPDTLARLGGDEFAILLHNCDETGIEIVIERLLDNVTRPFKVGENTLIADLSIGSSVYPQHGKNLTELLRHADAEMYRAKQSGGGLAIKTQKIESPAGMEM